MKFKCERSVLLKEIGIAQEIASPGVGISILSNVYLETTEDKLIIKSTDIKVNFETKVPVTVTETGATTVFCGKFLGILNSIPDGELEFEFAESKFNIKTVAKKVKFQLKTIDAENFPAFPVSAEENFFSMPVKDFKDMILKTIFAVSDDETRYYMGGVLFEKAENKVNMVATDGRRLALISKEVGDDVPNFESVIVPPKILNVLTKRAGDEGPVSIAVTDKNIFIKFGSYNLSSVLIEGQFPGYRRVIPENQERSFSVNRIETLDALRRVSILVEKSKRVYFGLAPGVLSFTSEESDYGIAKEDVPCKYDGEELTIAMNHKCIEEPFRVMSDDEICIKFTDASKAVTIKPEPESDFLYVVMPMQVQ
jgi:DNA polymerase-3 subunit beta